MITVLICKDKSYLIVNPFGIIDGNVGFSFYFNPENLTMWKVRGAKNTIMAYEGDLRDADLIRYIKLFKGEITEELIADHIIPKMKKIYNEYGRLTDEKQFGSYFYLLQKNKGYCIKKNGDFYPIISIDSNFGEDYIEAYIYENRKESELYSVLSAIKSYNDYLGNNAFPLIILDTTSEKFRYIENEGKLWELA
jgi:hypothetical protein